MSVVSVCPLGAHLHIIVVVVVIRFVCWVTHAFVSFSISIYILCSIKYMNSQLSTVSISEIY